MFFCVLNSLFDVFRLTHIFLNVRRWLYRREAVLAGVYRPLLVILSSQRMISTGSHQPTGPNRWPPPLYQTERVKIEKDGLTSWMFSKLSNISTFWLKAFCFQGFQKAFFIFFICFDEINY
jgi:hypothetical protein